MSGPLTVPFTVLAILLEAKWQKILFGVLALLCGAFASYQIWKRERQSTARLQRELDELKRCKLIFEIDEKFTQIRVEHFETHGPCILAKIALRFENRESQQACGKRLELALYKKNAVGDVREIPTLTADEPKLSCPPLEDESFEGMRFDHGVTPFYWYTAYIEIAVELVEDPEHFLRLTMFTAGYQDPLRANMFFNWAQAFRGNARVFVFPRSLVAQRSSNLIE